MDITKIIELSNLAVKNIAKYQKKRFIFDQINQDVSSREKHFIGIVGARGSGKTILLKQLHSVLKNSIYISLDTIEGNLFEYLQELHEKLDVKIFFLDEVHFYSGFEGALKKIYDFLDVKIVFTSSMALALRESAYDLSRRVILKIMYPFSLREYVYFNKDIKLDALCFGDVIENKYNLDYLKIMPYFKKYIEGWIMPFALEEISPLEIQRNILQTVIYKDIAKISSFGIDELDKIAKIVSFIGKSKVDGINYTSLSRNIGITKFKAQQYVDFLEKAFIVHQVFPKGTNVLREPKILMALPYRLLYSDIDLCVGGVREDFFVETIKMMNKEIFYLKNKRGAKTPDFLITYDNREIICEVGGKNKGTQQFKGIDVKEKIIFADGINSKGKKRPLMIIGCCV